MITYSRHNCDRAHRSPATWARCAFPRAHWVTGYHHGAYASVSYCRGTTVMLWATQTEAEEAVRQIDASACGGACGRNHRVIGLRPFLTSPVVRAAA